MNNEENLKGKRQKVKTRGNGEGTIYKSGKTGLYVGQYVVNGKRHSIYQRRSEKIGDFKKRFNDILSDVNRGSYIEASSETIVSLAKQYVNQKHEDGITSPRSYKRDIETIEQMKKTCSKFCNIPIQKVTLKNIEEAKIEMKKYSNSVIDKIWTLLNVVFKIASSPSRKIILFNIMQDVYLKKPLSDTPTKKVRPLSSDEFEKLLSVLDNEERNHKYRNIVRMQSISSMRIGEVLARSRNDYDQKKQTLNVCNTITQDENYKPILGKHTKTFNKATQIDEGQRFLPLNNNLFSGLTEIIEEEYNKKVTNIHNLLFWDYNKNTFITPNEINSWLSRLNSSYNICNENLTTHRIRHTVLNIWRNKGIPLSVIQYLAGHVEGSNVTEDAYLETSFEFVEETLRTNFK